MVPVQPSPRLVRAASRPRTRWMAPQGNLGAHIGLQSTTCLLHSRYLLRYFALIRWIDRTRSRWCAMRLIHKWCDPKGARRGPFGDPQAGPLREVSQGTPDPKWATVTRTQTPGRRDLPGKVQALHTAQMWKVARCFRAMGAAK